jgi:ORF6N domain
MLLSWFSSFAAKGVMFDADLAMLYGVRTKALNQALFRNNGRFPEDFAFQLTKEEFDHLRSQIVTSSVRPKSARFCV